MHFRMRSFAVAFAIAIFMAACGEDSTSLGVNDCDAACPQHLQAVSHCPAFTTCVEFEACGETLVCAPPAEANQNANSNSSGQDPDCEQSPSCPLGTAEVTQCPDGQLCTRITHCEETVLCHEIPNFCQNQPLCPDGDRPHPEYECTAEDPQCYRHQHCSGPVTCLRCEELPESCPEGAEAIDEQDCQDDVWECEVVETCDETLYCGFPLCLEEPHCPGMSVEVDHCPPEDRNCFSLTACEAQYHCGPPDEGECLAIPSCPAYHEQVSFDECLADYDNCTIEAACGTLIGCLPEP